MNGGTGITQPSSLFTDAPMRAQLDALQAVERAAREWRRVYWRWIRAENGERDMARNGENFALSKLLDALGRLDEARRDE